MLLEEYFRKHLGKGESINGHPDGFYIGDPCFIKEVNHGRRSRHYPFTEGIVATVPVGWTVVANGTCPPYGNNIVSEATASKSLSLIEQAKEIHREITELLNNESEPPPPANWP